MKTLVIGSILWFALLYYNGSAQARVINCHYDNGSDFIVCNDRGED